MKKNKKKDNSLEELTENKNQSFFEKMKTDKQYNAKVQLIGFGVFIVVIIIYLNIASMGSSTPVTNSLMGNISGDDGVTENADQDDVSLLKQLDDNYYYDVRIEVDKKNEEKVLEEVNLRYYGKVYAENQEFVKENSDGEVSYYKVDNHYYGKEQEEMKLVEEELIYDLIDREYVELEDILALMDKASLDHVTDYSSGKKEYVYHLKVRDVIVSYQLEDVVEIKVEEENGILKIVIDYSNLIKVVDDSIEECELEMTVSEIGKIEEFSVLEQDENESASEE